MSATRGDNDPSVVLWLSPTQIDLLELCERKYFFDRILKMRAATASYQQFGVDVENHIEAALKNGVATPGDQAGRVAKAMLEHLPAPGTPGMEFQKEMRLRFRLDERNAAAFFGIVGKKDLVIPGKVIDFKTTKDPKKYMKTAPMLLKDIQAQTYALDEMLTRHAVEMPLLWVYGQSKGAAKAFASPATMPHATAAQAITRGRAAALRILDLKKPGVKAEDTKFNTGACDAFGGCSHRAYCPARAKNLAQLFGFEKTEEAKMGIRDKLQASLGQPAGLPPPAQGSPVTDPATVAAIEREKANLAKHQAEKAAAAPPNAAAQVVAQITGMRVDNNLQQVATPAVGSNGKPILFVGDAACEACEGTGWNKKGGPCKFCGGSGEASEAAAIAASAPPAVGINPPDALPSPDDAPTPVQEAAPPAATKRTRRTKAEMDAAKASPVVAEAQQVGDLIAPHTETGMTFAEAVRAVGLMTPNELVKPATGLTLYVDCFPTKGGPAQSMDAMVQAAVVRAAKKAGVDDYRLVEYGKGPAFVTLAMAEIFQEVQPIGVFTINSRLPESGAVLGWLIDQASVVVKGVL